MKKLLIILLAAVAIAACSIQETESDYQCEDKYIYASIEEMVLTKTLMDENNSVLWSEDDQIVAFLNSTVGSVYQIMEQYVGTTAGGFSKVENADDNIDSDTAQDIDHNVLVYPYSDAVLCMKNDNSSQIQSYKLNIVLPETQKYAENSFADGAFPMVAVSANNKFTFKNICGGVKLQFKGEDKIKSIKVEGLAGEFLSGKSSVVAYVDSSDPVITMTDAALSKVILDCGDGVQLHPDAPVTFIIALPPVEFKSGMKITVTDTDGLSRTLTNPYANTIKRSSLLTFPVITYNQEGVFEIPEGTLTSYVIPAEGGTVEIPVVTNQEYEVVTPEDATEWITVIQTKALHEETIVLDIAENIVTEERSAEVQITAQGLLIQVLNIKQEAHVRYPQEGDYIDEYGINHGPGVNQGNWAPVNCGYLAPTLDESGNVIDKGFPQGKAYQFGRRWGFGFSNKDASTPVKSDEVATLDMAQSEYYQNTHFNKSISGYYTDLWNLGTEDDPVKSEYDPCPEGWRVPTYNELKFLAITDVGWWTNSSSGTRGFSIKYSDGTTLYMSKWGRCSNKSYVLAWWYGDYVTMSQSYSEREAYAVRCRRDDRPLIPVASLKLGVASLSLEGGESYTIPAAIEPSDANHQNAYWWSSNPDVATVDSNGNVIAVSKGTAVITAMAGMKTATCEVVVTSSTPKDYIDEYNVNYGAGVNIDGVIWAPVNCGYHKTDYPYGKLYQWGRRYGQGYSGDEYKDGSYVECNDALIPNIVRSSVSLKTGQDMANKNTVYLPDTSDWTSESSDKLWNSGSESKPIKTEYDPCPAGWRVPTYLETKSLGKYVLSTNEKGQIGYYFSGSKEYAAADALLFLPFGGRWTYFGYADDRGEVGYYWTSRAATDKQAYYSLLYSEYLLLDDNIRMYGCSVRCVQE